MIKQILICLPALFLFFGCENTNPYLAIDAGLDALKAVTLSDGDVKLVGDRYDSDGYAFDFKGYLSSQVNAFAMAA